MSPTCCSARRFTPTGNMQILRSADIRECLAPIREGAGSGRKGKKVAAAGGGREEKKRKRRKKKERERRVARSVPSAVSSEPSFTQRRIKPARLRRFLRRCRGNGRTRIRKSGRPLRPLARAVLENSPPSSAASERARALARSCP